MGRIFILSFLAGLVLAVAAFALFPLPDHARYRSEIEVLQNGGRAERFLIRWPQDRIELPGRLPGTEPAATPGTVVLREPGGAVAAAELFRLRDVAGNVIGVASRVSGAVAASNGRSEPVSNWMLMIPSRGSLLLAQVNGVDTVPRPSADGWLGPAEVAGFWARDRVRISSGPAAGGGTIVRGTEEFAGLAGSYAESWELEEVDTEGRTEGRIVLSTVIEARQ